MDSASWLALGIAVIGVLGTLTATVVTHCLGSKREAHRLKWEKDAERARWEREDGHRRQQQEREDRGRWLADKRSVYAEYQAALHKWHAEVVDAGGISSGKLEDEAKARCEKLKASHDYWFQVLSLIAPADVVASAHKAMFKTGVLSLDTFGDREHPYQAITYYRLHQNLLDIMRKDLGADH